jgi:hypothetical protein
MRSQSILNRRGGILIECDMYKCGGIVYNQGCHMSDGRN